MKLALLGYGFMGGAHLAAMQRIDGVQVVSVATRTRPAEGGPTRGNLALESGPLPDSVAWVPEWQQVLADPKIDAVDVCLPTDLHREVVVAAFAAGKHVLCEKPMALNTADCEAMMAAAEQAGRTFMVGQVLRFMYPYRYAAEFLRESHGTVTRCVLRRKTGFPQWGGWLTDVARSGGAILDLLSHDLDQALSLFGEPETVRAVSVGPVDTAMITLRYGTGLEVRVEGGWYPPETPFSASFEIDAGDASLLFEDGVLRQIDAAGQDVMREIPPHDPYFDEIAYFVACCRRNVSPDLCPPAASAAAVRLSTLLQASREANGKDLAWQR